MNVMTYLPVIVIDRDMSRGRHVVIHRTIRFSIPVQLSQIMFYPNIYMAGREVGVDKINHARWFDNGNI